jgi:hypothetical protein
MWVGTLRGDSGHCELCGGLIGDTAYTVQDKVTEEKKMICHDCLTSTTLCFICGLPVKTNPTSLPDGRTLCARDAKTAVLDDDRAREICFETRDNLDRLFSRFLSFPATNVTVGIVDRVTLQTLFKFAGRDHECPNVWGFLETKTNHGRLEQQISLLSALPVGSFKATCAHEYGHAWLNQHLSAARRKHLNQDANEGFCELIAYLLMDSQHEEAAKKQIRLNAYTRGQIHSFLDAERLYGFNDVVDWMKYGTDDRLKSDEPARVRAIEGPPRPNPPAPSRVFVGTEPSPVPEALTLKGISGTSARPMALINDHTFEVNEEAKVRVGRTNVIIRCLAIHGDVVRIRIAGSGDERQLRLRQPAP